jgi:hypothetical protein
MGLIKRVIAAILEADDEGKATQPELLFVQRIKELAYEEARRAETERFGPRP